MATILDSFGSLLIAIFKRSIEIPEFFMRFIMCLILIFTGLIYNEIIILNFCGLQKNTKLFLENKSKIETTIGKITVNFLEIEKDIIKQEGMENGISLKDILPNESCESFSSSIIY